MTWTQPLVACLLGVVSILGCQPQTTTPAASTSTEFAANSPEGLCLARANAVITLPAEAPPSVDVAHVLVRHADLERPQGATRSRGAACLQALAALEALQGGAEWNEVVERYADSGQSTHGELGTIHADEVSPAFARAAFSLDHNELSYVVETDRGFHVILRH